MPSNFDPLNVNVRLYEQVSEMLSQLENSPNITLRERIAALIAIGRIQVLFVNLRKEKINDPGSGSSVRKYAAAFKAHDARRRKAIAGPKPEPEPEPEPEPAIDDPFGDDDDDDRDAAE
jgi:hypothetical protein